jgi:hypothetical protein
MKTFMLACLLSIAGTAGAQTTLYDTFNEADQADLFDCCNALPITAKDTGVTSTVAIPFVPTGAAHIINLQEVDVALSYTSGKVNKMTVEIDGPTDPNGHPHRIKTKLSATAILPGGQCCVFQALPANGLHLKSGSTYWVVVSTKGDTVGGWNLNSAGLKGLYQTWNGKRWSPVKGPLPAVRLIAE